MTTPLAIHNCHRCDGLLNPEHYTELATTSAVTGEISIVVTEYCDFCRILWEHLYQVLDGARHHKFTRTVDPRRNPVEFGKAFKHLMESVEVAA